MNTLEIARSMTAFGWPQADGIKRIRVLREAGLLPQGGRGGNAPDVGPRHVAVALIGFAASTNASHIAAAVETYGTMSLVAGNIAGNGSFLEALTIVFENPHLAARIETLRICRSWPEARIVARRDDRDPEMAHYARAADRAAARDRHLRIDVTLAGALIRTLNDGIHGMVNAGS